MGLFFRWDSRDHKGSGYFRVVQRQGEVFTRFRGRAENIVFNLKLWLLFRLTHWLRLLGPTNRRELWTLADWTRCAAKPCITQWLKLPTRWLSRRDWKVSRCCLCIYISKQLIWPLEAYFAFVPSLNCQVFLMPLSSPPPLSFTTGSGRDGVKGRAGSASAPLQCWRRQPRECLPLWRSHLFVHYFIRNA